MTVHALAPYLPSALDAQLEDWGPLPEATDQPMATAGATRWEEGEASVGVWQCEAGPSRWKLETNELVHILAGRLTITPDEGSEFTLAPGDVAFFPRGWCGAWQLHEPVRKVFAVF